MFNWLIHWFSGKPLSAILGAAHTLYAELTVFEDRMTNLIVTKKEQKASLDTDIAQHEAEKVQAANVKTFIEGLVKPNV